MTHLPAIAYQKPYNPTPVDTANHRANVTKIICTSLYTNAKHINGKNTNTQCFKKAQNQSTNFMLKKLKEIKSKRYVKDCPLKKKIYRQSHPKFEDHTTER